MSGTKNILEVEALHAHYGKSHVLQGVSMTVGEAELVTLLGRNGAGKSTTLKSIAGAVTPTSGRVRFQGADVAGLPPHGIAARGVPGARASRHLQAADGRRKPAARPAPRFALATRQTSTKYFRA
jgi:ABC-type branched-subunit amino acid transport system ATPase component